MSDGILLGTHTGTGHHAVRLQFEGWGKSTTVAMSPLRPWINMILFSMFADSGVVPNHDLLPWCGQFQRRRWIYTRTLAEWGDQHFDAMHWAGCQFGGAIWRGQTSVSWPAIRRDGADAYFGKGETSTFLSPSHLPTHSFPCLKLWLSFSVCFTCRWIHQLVRTFDVRFCDTLEVEFEFLLAPKIPVNLILNERLF